MQLWCPRVLCEPLSGRNASHPLIRRSRLGSVLLILGLSLQSGSAPIPIPSPGRDAGPAGATHIRRQLLRAALMALIPALVWSDFTSMPCQTGSVCIHKSDDYFDPPLARYCPMPSGSAHADALYCLAPSKCYGKDVSVQCLENGGAVCGCFASAVDDDNRVPELCPPKTFCSTTAKFEVRALAAVGPSSLLLAACCSAH